MSEMTGTPTNVEMSGAQVTFNGVDLGFTEGGVTISYGQTFTIFQPDQSTMAVKSFLTGETVTAVVPLAEYSIPPFNAALPTGTLETDSGDPTKQVIYLGGGCVEDSDLALLVLHPVHGGSLTLEADLDLVARI